ncbi:MAG: Rha family transcriptional regulator [Selenomonadaceae bacterium]|nr:Rha family transcriptional regulator [Selenomonadaceae bacterium]
MNTLVFLKHKQALTTSLKVAEYFGKRHDRLLQTIEEQYGGLHEFVEMFRKTTYTDNCGRRQPMYLMNRDGFSLLAMGFTGKKALQFKLDYIKAFNAMEAALAERASAEWQEIRSETKRGYKDLSAAVHELYEWAASHGCKASEKVFYMNFAKLLNKTLGINPGERDDLAAWQLYEIDKLQFIARTIIAGLIASGEDYHLPYKNCKSAFESYARLSYINERLLLAQRRLSD